MSAKKILFFAAMACLALSGVALGIGEDEFLPPERFLPLITNPGGR